MKKVKGRDLYGYKGNLIDEEYEEYDFYDEIFEKIEKVLWWVFDLSVLTLLIYNLFFI